MPLAKAPGSTKLAFKPTDVKRLMAQLKKLKAKPDVIINGTPWPDWVKGTFSAPNSPAASAGILEILKLGGTFKPIKLFPKGKPAIDEVLVHFDVRAR